MRFVDTDGYLDVIHSNEIGTVSLTCLNRSSVGVWLTREVMSDLAMAPIPMIVRGGEHNINGAWFLSTISGYKTRTPHLLNPLTDDRSTNSCAA